MATPYSGPQSIQEERTWAMLAHLLGFLTSVIGPLIIWLIKRKQSSFVAFHSLQALLFQAAVAVIYAAAHNLLFTGPMLLVEAIAAFINLAVSAFAAYSAWEGRPWEIPVIGRYARRWSAL